MKLHIEIGAMCPKLSEQLSDTRIPKGHLKFLDRLADARNMLFVQGILTEREAEMAARRIIKEAARLLALFVKEER